MNRSDTLQLLHAYRLFRPEEEASWQKVIQFVEEHEDFYARSNLQGHLTASAWICSPDFEKVLLIYHPQFNLWIQPGGHIELDDETILMAAEREAFEEVGLSSLCSDSSDIFDLDIHPIMATSKAGAHLHYDVRFLFTADPEEPFPKDRQALHALQWFSTKELLLSHPELSILRLLGKMQA